MFLSCWMQKSLNVQATFYSGLKWQLQNDAKDTSVVFYLLLDISWIGEGPFGGLGSTKASASNFTWSSEILIGLLCRCINWILSETLLTVAELIRIHVGRFIKSWRAFGFRAIFRISASPFKEDNFLNGFNFIQITGSFYKIQ